MYAADIRHHNDRLAAKLAHLYTLRGGPMIDLTIRPTYRAALTALGEPQNNLPPVIHVSGTNGKGSTLAFVQSAFIKAGYKVHRYTSPHLIQFNERIQIANEFIGDDELESLIDEVLAIPDSSDLTFFEITTIIAFLAFARNDADVALIEVGVGGRLDCTNVMEQPLLSIITSIGLDHTEFLGDTLEKIAHEKAGIIQRNGRVILGPIDDKDAHDAIMRTVSAQNAQVIFDAKECVQNVFTDHTWSMTYHDDIIDYLPWPSLEGGHQFNNASLAITALNYLRPRFTRLSPSIIKEALANTQWPARMQDVTQFELRHLFPAQSTIIVDGGHNEAAGLALSAHCENWQQDDNRPLLIIMAMMKTKNVTRFIAPLAPYADHVLTLTIENEDKAWPAQDLAQLITEQENAPPVTACKNWDDIAAFASKLKAPMRVLFCGSLYLAGQALRAGNQTITP
jgi:dihydrofolate synthase/folylpolyglutamate synthase